jgi:hypothetical protein
MTTNTNYTRTLLLKHDEDRGINWQPPSANEIIAVLLDPNNQTMISSGLYSQSEATARINAAYQHFIDVFGLDFQSGTVLGNGQYNITDFFLLPYFSGIKSGTQIEVSLDTEHKDRAANNRWRAYQFGQLVLATGSGTFPGGTRAGETYVAGDVFAFWDYQLIKTNGCEISSNQQRETLRCNAQLMGTFVPGSQGYKNFHSTADVYDQDGNLGFFVESIIYVKDLNTNMVSSHTRQIITFTS